MIEAVAIADASLAIRCVPTSYARILSVHPHGAGGRSDYDDDDLLPVIPWAPHIKQVSLKSESNEWTTVKSKKKHR